MKKKQYDEQPQTGRRFRKAVDGPKIKKWYATTPTAKLARRLRLMVKQIENFVHRENPELWARKDAATKSRINSENGRTGGRPRKNSKK